MTVRIRTFDRDSFMRCLRESMDLHHDSVRSLADELGTHSTTIQKMRDGMLPNAVVFLRVCDVYSLDPLGFLK